MLSGFHKNSTERKCRIAQPERCAERGGCEWKNVFGYPCNFHTVKELKSPEPAIRLSNIERNEAGERKHAAKKEPKKQKAANPYGNTGRNRWVWNRSNGICYICGKPVAFNEMSVDHVIPKARGGTNDPGNLRATHKGCNNKKGAKWPSKALRDSARELGGPLTWIKANGSGPEFHPL